MTEPELEATRKTEWSVLLEGDLGGVLGTSHIFPALEGKHFALARARWWRQTRPDVTATVVHRDTEVRRGPWVRDDD